MEKYFVLDDVPIQKASAHDIYTILGLRGQPTWSDTPADITYFNTYHLILFKVLLLKFLNKVRSRYSQSL